MSFRIYEGVVFIKEGKEEEVEGNDGNREASGIGDKDGEVGGEKGKRKESLFL